jgi:uncharacterized protein YuzE
MNHALWLGVKLNERVESNQSNALHGGRNMKRVWIVLTMASLLVGCSSVQTARRVDQSQQVQSPILTATTPVESVKRLYPDELSQVQSVTIHDYENGAVKSVDDPKLVKQLMDKLSEARPAPESPLLDVQGFQYMMWLTLGDRRQIRLIVWPGSSKVDLIDAIGGSAWQVSELSDVMMPLLPSSDQDKKYIGRTQAIECHDKTLVLRPVNPAFGFGSDNTITVTIKGTLRDYGHTHYHKPQDAEEVNIMHIRYDPESNAAYIYLTDTPNEGVVTTCGCDAPIGAPINLDFDSHGRLIGIEVLQAREKLPEALLKVVS